MTRHFARGGNDEFVFILSLLPPSVQGLFIMNAMISHNGGASIRSTCSLYSFNRRTLSVGSYRWPRSLSSTTTPSRRERIVFSGIQPTGVPHIGNYLGALRQWVKLQDDAEPGTRLFFSIVDLHALTVPQNAIQLKRWKTEAFAALLAVGLDPKKSTLFYQSTVSSIILFLGGIFGLVVLTQFHRYPHTQN